MKRSSLTPSYYPDVFEGFVILVTKAKWGQVVLLLALLLLGLGAGPLVGQVAHSVGEVTTFGSGFDNAHAVVLDPAGNVYVASYFDGKVYKETPDGNGGYSQSVFFSGLGAAVGLARDTTGNFYIAGNGLVYKETLQPDGSYVQSTLSSFDDPVGVAVDQTGDVFVADQGQSTIYELAAGTYAKTTIDSQGVATPFGIYVDPQSNLYVGAVRGQYIYKYTLNNGVYTRSDLLDAPSTYGVVANSAGDLFYASPTQFLKATLSGGSYSTGVYYPYRVQALAEDSNNVLYLVSFFYGSGIRLNPAPDFGAATVGTTATRQVTLSFVLDSAATLGQPRALIAGREGADFAVASTTCTGAMAAATSCTVTVSFTPTVPGARLGGVDLMDTAGNVLASGVVRGTGTGAQGVFLPGTVSNLALGTAAGPVAVDGQGAAFLANGNGKLLKASFGSGGASTAVIGQNLGTVAGLAVDGLGDVFVADSTQQQVEEELFDPATGAYTQSVPFTAAANGLGQLGAVAVDGGGTVYLGNGTEVLRELPNGAGYMQSTLLSGFVRIASLALDSSGALFVADGGTATLYKETPLVADSVVTYNQSVVATGLSRINAVALDASGAVYVTAPGSSDNVLRFVPDGAGGYTAANALTGPAAPGGVALDGSGNVLIAGSIAGGGMLTRLDVADSPTLSFAARAVGTASLAQTVTLRNIGNQSLVLAGLGISTANWALDGATTTCPEMGSLALSADCNLGFRFTPQLAGPLTGTGNITDNNLGQTAAVEQVNLLGAGNSGPLTLTVPGVSISAGTSTATLTAMVAYAGTVSPSGTVQFTVDNGMAVLATCSNKTTPLTCSAEFPSGTLAAGDHTIRATMAGDLYYQAGSGTAVLTVVPVAVPGFDLTNQGPTSATVTAGGAADLAFLLSPTGAGYPGEVGLTATGLPPSATYTLTPSAIGANGGTQSVTLHIQTGAPQIAAHSRRPSRSGRDAGIALACLAAPLCLLGRRRRFVNHLTGIFLVLLSLAAMGTLAGCGLIREGYAAPQTYTVTVTAASGTVQHAATVQLTVQ